MVKKKKETEQTQIDDLDAFEEWEGDDDLDLDLEDDTPVPTAGEDGVLAAGEELDLPDFEEKVSEEKPAPKAKGKGKAKAKPKAPASVKEEVTEEEFADALMDLAPDVPVNLVAVIGKSTTNVGDLMKTRVGNVIDLGRPPGETVDLVANGRLIARGELVEMDGQLGVRILKMVK